MKSLRIIVAGGRDFNDYKLLCDTIDNYIRNKAEDKNIDIKNIEFISGRARGTDTYGEMYASEHRYILNMFPANWGFMGKPAGYFRNEQMAKFATMAPEYYDAVLIAFWNGESKGTGHMIDLAKKYNFKDIIIVSY